MEAQDDGGWEEMFKSQVPAEDERDFEFFGTEDNPSVPKRIQESPDELYMSKNLEESGRFFMLEVHHSPNLPRDIEEFDTFMTHLACSIENTMFLTTRANYGSFSLAIPIPKGDLPYDTSIVMQQFVKSFILEGEKRVEIINGAGSLIVPLRELHKKREVEDLAILYPALFAGHPLEACVKSRLKISLVSCPEDVKFLPMTELSVCPENMPRIQEKIETYYKGCINEVRKREHTDERLRDLNGPPFCYNGIFNYPTSFAITNMHDPTPEWWENAAKAGISATFPGRTFEESLSLFEKETSRSKLTAAAVRAAAHVVQQSHYCGDFGYYDRETLNAGKGHINSLKQVAINARRMESSFRPLGGYHHTKTNKKLEACMNNVGELFKERGVQVANFEDFSMALARTFLKKINIDCEDSSMGMIRLLVSLQRMKNLGPLAARLQKQIETKHAIFGLWSAHGPKSVVDSKEIEGDPGGHAAGVLAERSQILFNFKTAGISGRFGSELTIDMKNFEPTQIGEGTSTVKSNVRDIEGIEDFNRIIEFWKFYPGLKDHFNVLRPAPITEKNEDPFYLMIHQGYDATEAAKGIDSPWICFTKNGKIGAPYKDFIGVNGRENEAGAFAFPAFKREDYSLMKSLNHFATPTPSLKAPSRQFLVDSPIDDETLISICKSVELKRRSAPKTHPIVLFLPYQNCCPEAYAILNSISEDENTIFMSAFNCAATDYHRMYQVNIFRKVSE
jgi:hypothetical protein